MAIAFGLESFSPFTLVATRFLLAGFPLVLFYKFPPVPLSRLAIYALFIGVLQYGLMFLAIRLKLPAGLSSVLIQFQVYITIALARFVYGEKVSIIQIGGFFVSAIGLVVIAYEYILSAEYVAFALIMFSALSWSCGNLIIKSFKITDFAGFIAWTSFLSALPLIPLALVVDGPEQIVAQFSNASLKSYLAILFMSVFATHTAFTLFSKMMLRLPAARVMPFATLVPIVGLASNAIFRGEKLTTFQLSGSIIVIVGILVTVIVPALRRTRAA